MTPRSYTPPEPPEKVLRAMRASRAAARSAGNPILARYLRYLHRIGGWWILGTHYLLVAIMVAGIWPFAMSGPVPHPEIVLKLTGSFCFLIGSLVIPLVAPVLFPPFGETDPAWDAMPMEPVQITDSRLQVVIVLAGMALLPLLPLFLIFSPTVGRPSTVFYAMPFLQGILTTIWVYILMEMTGQADSLSARLTRRLALIVGFVLIHVALVGLLAQLSWATIQTVNPLKLLIDLNPFGQLFILMEGAGQSRMIMNSDFQRLVDYRVYLFMISGFFTALVWLVYRETIASRSVPS